VAGTAAAVPVTLNISAVLARSTVPSIRIAPPIACDHQGVEALRKPDGQITLTMSEAEAVVLHEVIAFSEWSNELDAIELREPTERKTLSEVQQALAPLIPGLGTDAYQRTVAAAQAAIDSSPF
jgi:hypothetical protein